MIRRTKIEEANRGERAMTALEQQLQGVGIALHPNTGDLSNLASLNAQLSESTLSGYGSYRPITVRSYSMPENANLERRQ